MTNGAINGHTYYCRLLNWSANQSWNPNFLSCETKLSSQKYSSPQINRSKLHDRLIRSAFGAVVEKLIRREASPPAGRRLLTTTRVLLQVAELATLATLVFSRHLGDVMAALCQLGYEPHREDHRVSLPSYMLLRPKYAFFFFFFTKCQLLLAFSLKNRSPDLCHFQMWN